MRLTKAVTQNLPTDQFLTLTLSAGNPDIPDPPNEGPTDLRGRIRQARDSVRALAGTLPRVLGLVWTASRTLTLGLAFATVLAGIVPAITALIAKQLIDAVVRAITANVTGVAAANETLGPLTLDPTGIVVLLAAAQFLIYALSSFLSTLRNVCQQLLQERVTNTIQLQIMEHAAKLDLAFFEDSTSYDLLRRAQQGAASRPLFMVRVPMLLLPELRFKTRSLPLIVSPVPPLMAPEM